MPGSRTSSFERRVLEIEGNSIDMLDLQDFVAGFPKYHQQLTLAKLPEVQIRYSEDSSGNPVFELSLEIRK